MDVFADILFDWHCCCPEGGVALTATRIGTVVKCAMLRVQRSPLSNEEREEIVQGLFSVQGSGLPPFLRLLHMSGGGGNNAAAACGDVIHFLRFWQAFHELWRRLRDVSCAASSDEEPLSEELAEFRDGLLRRFEHGGVTRDWLLDELASARNMSMDRTAWAPIESVVSGMGLGDPDRALRMDEVSAPLLQWLTWLSHDYRHGERAAAARNVCDVVGYGCSRRTACSHLGSQDWDVEAALRSLYSDSRQMAALSANGGPPAAVLSSLPSWSSRGAKLRQSEVECAICMENYGEENGAKRLVETHCCHQVLCSLCHMKVVDEQGLFCCPYCRVVGRLPQEVQANAAVPVGGWSRSLRTQTQLGSKLLQKAGRLADLAGSAVNGVVTAVLDIDRPVRHHHSTPHQHRSEDHMRR